MKALLLKCKHPLGCLGVVLFIAVNASCPMAFFTLPLYVTVEVAPRDADVQKALADAQAWCFRDDTGFSNATALCVSFNQNMVAAPNLSACEPLCDHTNSTVRAVLCLDNCKAVWHTAFDTIRRTVDPHRRLTFTILFWVPMSILIVAMMWGCIFHCCCDGDYRWFKRHLFLDAESPQTATHPQVQLVPTGLAHSDNV
jgi:hypothetical protein